MEKEEKQKPIPAAQYDKNEEWVQTHIQQFGEEPSFFWNGVEAIESCIWNLVIISS